MHGKGVDDSGFGGGPGGSGSGCDGEGVNITQVSTVAGGSTHTTTTRRLHTPTRLGGGGRVTPSVGRLLYSGNPTLSVDVQVW